MSNLIRSQRFGKLKVYYSDCAFGAFFSQLVLSVTINTHKTKPDLTLEILTKSGGIRSNNVTQSPLSCYLRNIRGGSKDSFDGGGSVMEKYFQ